MEVVRSGGFTPLYDGDARKRKAGMSASGHARGVSKEAAVLSLYADAPNEEAALEELESFALDRLKGKRGEEHWRWNGWDVRGSERATRKRHAGISLLPLLTANLSV